MNPNNCATCEYMRYPHEGGHCYMFRFAPTEICKQHTSPLLDALRLSERNLSSLDASHSVAGTFGPWLAEVRKVIKGYPMKPKIDCAVMRFTPLDKPFQWADGDFIKTFPDGTTAPATYPEYCASRGLPVGPNEKIDAKQEDTK